MLNYGAFLRQHTRWTLELFGHIETQTAGNVLTWSDVRYATSRLNTLKLFMHLQRAYDRKPAESMSTENKENTDNPDDVREFISPVRQRPKMTRTTVGNAMVVAFRSFSEIIELLRNITFQADVVFEDDATQTSTKKVYIG